MSNEHVNDAFHYALNQIYPPVKPVTVKPFFEVSEDQNVVTVAARLQFVEGGGCDMCAANRNKCHMFPCLPVERTDGKLGHFVEVRG
jgi:hypothetical protein